VVFSRDGKTLASASNDMTVKLWDTTTYREKATLRGHKVWLYTLAFSPDGKTLASAGGLQPAAIDTTIYWRFEDIPKDPKRLEEIGELKVWDPATARELMSLSDVGGRIDSVAFSPDGMTLAVASHRGGRARIRLLDVATGEERTCLKEDSSLVQSVTFAPDRNTLASVEWHTVKLWDLASGQVRSECSADTEKSWIAGLAFRADGKTFATVGNKPDPRNPQEVLGEVRLWETATGRLLGPPLRLGQSAAERTLAIHKATLAVGGPRDAGRSEVEIWDLGGRWSADPARELRPEK
jgi:WD40 repeat protein